MVNWILVTSYLVAEYITALRRGRIDPPCMRQFITVSIGAGVLMIYYASGIDKDMNMFTSVLSLLCILFFVVYMYIQTDTKPSKPTSEYLLTKYKRVQLPEDSPDDCVVCLDLVTCMYYSLQCRHCKHCFHKKCLRRWCDESASCPQCRYEYH